MLSQLLETPFWAKVIENLEELEDQLLTLPHSQGQTLSNQELFDSILGCAQREMALDPPSPLADSEDEG